MSCSIKKNALGKVTSIKGNSPFQENLVKDLLNVPSFTTLDEVSESLINISTLEGVEDAYKGISYRSQGKEYSDYETMLREQENSPFEVLVNIGDTKVSFSEATLETNDKTAVGRVNKSILKGNITGQSFQKDGKIHFEPFGYSTLEKIQSAKRVVKDFGKHRAKKKDDNTIVFKEEIGISDVNSQAAVNVLEESVKSANNKPKVDLTNVESSLLNFLRNLGVSITTLDSYKKKHAIKNGSGKVVKALADISNGIIALSKGEEASLYEELSHFAVAHYADRESLEEARVEVVNTPEYAEFYEDYKQAYGKELEGIELETAIRDEVLGKIISDKLKNKTEHPVSLIQRFVNTVRDFFTNGVVSNVQSYHSEIVDKLTDKITQAINENNMSLFAENSFVEGQFFELDGQQSSLNQSIDNLVRGYNGLFNKAVKDISKVSFEEARKIDGQFEAVRGIIALEKSLAAVEHIVKQVGSLNSQPNGGGVQLSTRASYLNFANELKKRTLELGNEIKQENVTEEQVLLVDKYIDRLTKEYIKVDALLEEVVKEQVELGRKGFEKDAKKAGFSEEQSKSMLESVMYDISKFFQWLMPVSDSSNPILARLPKLISNMLNEAGIISTKKVSDYTAFLTEKGWIDGKLNKDIISKRDGQSVGEFISPYSKFDQLKERKDFKINKLIELTGKDLKTITKPQLKEIETVIDNNESLETLGLNSEQILEFKKAVAENVRKTRINPNDSSYYEARENDYEELGVTNATRVYLKQNSTERNSIVSKTFNEDGKPDKSKLSETEKVRLEELAVANKIKKSAFNLNTEKLKEGIKVVKIKDLTQKEKDATPKNVLEFFNNSDPELEVIIKDVEAGYISEEAQITLDLNNLDYNFFNNNLKENDVIYSNDFLETLKEIEDNQGPTAALQWLRDNGGLTASDKLVEQIQGTVRYAEKVEDYLESLPEGLEKDKKQVAFQEFKDKNTFKNSILRPYKNTDPFKDLEITMIPQETLDTLFELERDMTDLKREIGLPLEENEEANSVEVKLNRNINKLVNSQSQQGLFDYLVKNMTRDNKALSLEFERQLKNYAKALQSGKSPRISTKYDDFIKESKTARAFQQGGMDSAKFIENILVEYATIKAPSFLKEYRPEGFSSFKSQIELGTIKLSDVLANKEKVEKINPIASLYDIKPSFTWREESALGSTINKEYKKDLTFDTYNKLNDEFFNKFFTNPEKAKQDWLDLSTDDISLLNADKNKEAFEYLIFLTNKNKEALEVYEESEMTSKYQLPQYMRSQLERNKSILSKKGMSLIKESITDTFKNNEDEMLEGQVIDELTDITAARIIPKYGVNQLKGKTSVSTDVVGSIGKFIVDAEIYKARQKYKENIEGTVELIKSKRFKDKFAGIRGTKSLRKGEESNTYRMARNKADEMLFGVKESYSMKTTIFGKEVDITAAATGFNKAVQSINLAYSPIVDLTSLTSGLVNTQIEGLVGEFYSGSSLRRAKSVLASMTTKYALETGEINKKSDLNKIGELLGLFSAKDRLDNTQFDKVTRNIVPTKSAFGFSEAMNLPVGGQILFASMMDSKLIDGSFITYDAFKKRERMNSENKMSNKELKNKWNSIKKNSLFDFIDFSGNSATFNENFKKEFPENTEDAFMEAILDVSSTIQKLNSQADGMMSSVDQTEAKRNFLTNFLMTHKSWYYLTLAKRFKVRGYDWMVGQETEGSYRNLAKNIGYIRKNAKKLTTLEGLKELQEELGKDQLNITSAKRVMVDSLMLLTLLGIGELIMAGDEPDDSFLEDLGQLIYLRTVAETNSTNIVGMKTNTLEMLKNPLVSLRQIEAIEPSSLFYDMFTLEGEKVVKRMRQNIPLVKRYYQMSDLNSEKGKYIKYNGEHLYNLVN